MAGEARGLEMDCTPYSAHSFPYKASNSAFVPTLYSPAAKHGSKMLSSIVLSDETGRVLSSPAPFCQPIVAVVYCHKQQDTVVLVFIAYFAVEKIALCISVDGFAV